MAEGAGGPGWRVEGRREERRGREVRTRGRCSIRGNLFAGRLVVGNARATAGCGGREPLKRFKNGVGAWVRLSSGKGEGALRREMGRPIGGGNLIGASSLDVAASFFCF